MTKDEALKIALEALEDIFGKNKPVAYLCENAVGHKYFRWKKPSGLYKPIALYTAPPQRQWVGLTDEEILEAWHWGGFNPHIEGAHFKVLYQYFEAKLNDKNA